MYAIDRSEAALSPMAEDGVVLFPGDAADRRLLHHAGIQRVSSVLLTTNDDAMNIYLAVFCRRLNASLRIAHERNVEAIHRAGRRGLRPQLHNARRRVRLVAAARL